MFQSLSDRLSGVLDKLTRRGSLTDSDVAEAMREVRRALLEADVALQGSGKPTTTAKIAYRLTTRDKKKVLMASLDTRRPAAQEQLRVLGEQTSVDTLPVVAGKTPQQITARAMEAARLSGYDVILLDTAGRTHI